MWSVKDMFYSEAEPVWIMKSQDNKKGPESKGDNSGSGGNLGSGGGGGGGSSRKQAEKAEEYSILSSIPYYPYYYPDYNPPPQQRREEQRTGNAYRGQQTFQQPSSNSYYSHYYPDYNPPPQPRREELRTGNASGGQQTGQQRGAPGGQHGGQQKKVVLKVPICCSECVESIEASLYNVKGIKSVECDTRREKVTVVSTTAAPADILMECRRVFKKSRFWTDDD